MSQRFFVESSITPASVQLQGPEAQHLAKVMRAQLGDQVVLFDGSGAEFAARITRIGRSEVELEVLERREIDRELPIALTLGVALPKGDRQRWLVEKIVELGVTRLVPLKTTRGVAQPVENALARLHRAVVEASKQCGRNRLMEIVEPQQLARYVAACPDTTLRWIAHPAASRRQLGPATNRLGPARPVCLAVGPEGGFTDEELQQALQAGWQPIDLGPRILRVETAATTLAAIVAAAVEGTEDHR